VTESTSSEAAAGRPAGDPAGTGEFGLIAAMTALFPQHEGVLVGPGDDAAVVAAPDSRVVVTTDLLVEGRHFRRDWSQPYDVGRKAAAENLADVAAMGAAPVALLVGLAVPPDLPVAWAVALAEGLRDEAGPAGASVVGGDTVGADQVVVAVTALGDLQGRAPVLRSGARPGDVLAVCGRLGWAAAGLAVLSRGFRSPRVLVDAHRRPEVDYAAGVEAARLGATAMVDVSDGLLADLGHVAAASGVGVDVDPGRLEVPAPLRDVGGALGVDPVQWVLTGGDDHALAACFPATVQLPGRWRVVGRVEDGEGVTVGGVAHEGPAGHDHFR
jgi:thiamine-monophosphate kinase